MSKKTVKIELDYDLQLMGIVSPIKDYRLGHFLSTSFVNDFAKQEDITLSGVYAGQNTAFSNYILLDAEGDQFIYLVSNRSMGMYYLPSLKEFDYFLVFYPLVPSDDLKEIIRMLKNIPDILESRNIPLSLVKEKERLICFIP